MPFHACGSARLDISSDSLRIDLDAGDTYVVPLNRLAGVMRGGVREAPLSRRYEGKPGEYTDVEGPHRLSRSRPGAAVVFVVDGAIYSIAMRPLQGVVHGEIPSAIVSQVITDAGQLSDASGRQATLEAF